MSTLTSTIFFNIVALYAHKKFHLKKIISQLNFDIAHDSKFSQSTANQIYYVLKHKSI